MNIIEIENLTYSYPAAESPILNHIPLRSKKETSLRSLATTAAGSPLFVRP